MFSRSANRKNPPRTAAALLAALVVASALSAPVQAAPEPKNPGAPSAGHSLRAPVTDENFYFVMADRFSNGSSANDDGGLGSDPMVSGFDPTKKGFYNGGDLKGLRDKIGYIQGLGTTSIWLTPSFKNKAVQPEDKSAGYHGYWVYGLHPDRPAPGNQRRTEGTDRRGAFARDEGLFRHHHQPHG